MMELSWGLAGCTILFQMLQAIVVGAIISLLLWLDKNAGARRKQTTGDRT